MLRTSDVDALIDWILNEGRESDDLEAILVGVSTRLVERGMPLCRVSLSMPTIDPAIAVIQHVWWRDEAVETSGLSVDFVGGDAFRHSPIRFLRENRRPGGRWKLDDPETLRRFPLFQELQARGVTEYALRITEFSEGRTALLGAGLAIATDRPGGFIEDEIEAALRLLPALAVVAYRIVLLSVATETLSAYLGPQTGARVLQGMIHRGDSRIISAALLLADLRGFTALVDTAQPEAVMTWLNEHFDGIGGAITERGGEILKFLGDGLLAVFPSAAGDPAAACAVAVDAALDAAARNAALNARRTAAQAPSLALTQVLNFGEVAYGNIGTARRLDFTVIGRAVNEASRMEALGKSLGRDLLLSASFARHCGRAIVSLGEYELRGIQEKREIFVLAER